MQYDYSLSPALSSDEEINNSVEAHEEFEDKTHTGCHTGCHHHHHDERILPVRQGEKIGRNDPCPCGSGQKYKKCCSV